MNLKNRILYSLDNENGGPSLEVLFLCIVSLGAFAAVLTLIKPRVHELNRKTINFLATGNGFQNTGA